MREHAEQPIREGEQIVRAVEKVKGQAWEKFRDQYGDWGRDAALHLGRRRGRMRLLDLGTKAGGLHYAAVGRGIHRFEARLKEDPNLRSCLRKIEAQLLNDKM